jgi:flavin reductase (DIM6/NTAB) family NADH-FMN oxidoreductase RutF
MDDRLREIKPEDLQIYPIRLIDEEWFLLSAGNLELFNTMTASWGGIGVLWNKPVVFCFVRPHRFTYEFMESNSLFTMSFFDEKYRKALDICGNMSGREVNKMKETGLTPFESPGGSIFYKEAKLLFDCRKLYYSDIDPKQFLDPKIAKNYPRKDYHRMYIGELTGCFEQD